MLKGYRLLHTHGPTFCEDLTDAMRRDIPYFKKNRAIIDIVNYLENKYGLVVDYQRVYYEYRKLVPLFGPQDCFKFISYLKSTNAFIKHTTSVEDKALTRLFFATPVMQQNYTQHQDILLMDATYKTNKYQIPLLVFSGISKTGRTILFGLALINDETYITYKWAIDTFLECYKNKRPNLIVTDSDAALCKVISELTSNYVDLKHFVCIWHLLRNLQRHYSYLKAKHKIMYDLVLSLPFHTTISSFQDSYAKLTAFLEKNKYDASLRYIGRLHDHKEKWADCYKPDMFTAGTNTTSRAESMNSAIKKFVNSKSELYALVILIEDMEQSFVLVDPLEVKKLYSRTEKVAYEVEPIVQSCKQHLGDLIYHKHYHEFYAHSIFTVKLKDARTLLNSESTEESSSNSEYSVFTNLEEVTKLKDGETGKDAKEARQDVTTVIERVVTLNNTRIKCTCRQYKTEGIVCRHMFAVAKQRGLKSIEPYLHPRWKITETNRDNAEYNCFEADQKIQLRKKEEAEIKEIEEEEEENLKVSRYLDSIRAESQKVANFTVKSTGKGKRKSKVRFSQSSNNEDRESSDEKMIGGKQARLKNQLNVASKPK